MKDNDSRLISEAYNIISEEIEREQAAKALIQAAGEGREDLHDLADDIRNAMANEDEYRSVLQMIANSIPEAERTPGLNSILASGLPPEEPSTRGFPRDDETLSPPDHVDADGSEASSGATDLTDIPDEWLQVFETLGFHEIEGIEEAVLELGPINGEFIRVSPDRIEDRLNLSVVGEEGPVPIAELDMGGLKFIDLPGGPNSKYWQYILASFIVSFFIRHNHDPGGEMMGVLDQLTDS